MIERLVESWLDSVNERGYQVPFCQMLSATGHSIVHSTRHGPLEFGRDIVSIDDRGTPCAFQLKGNPGGRLTKAAAAGIITQIQELNALPITFPGLPKKRHKAFLVTNGQVDEEAQKLLSDAAAAARKHGAASSFSIWSRGKLLDLAKSVGISLWPTELDEPDRLLSILVDSGKGSLPMDRLDDLLRSTLMPVESAAPSKQAVMRRISSAGVLVGVALRSFTRATNHAAITFAWTMFSTYALATAARYRLGASAALDRSISIAETAIWDALADLALELTANPNLIDNPSMAEGLVYRARWTRVGALLSLFYIHSEHHDRWPSAVHRSSVRELIVTASRHVNCWGEGAIPEILMIAWALRSIKPGETTDRLIGQLAGLVVESALSENRPLVTPYVDFEAHTLRELQRLGGTVDVSTRGDFLIRRSFFLEGLIHLLARQNLKRNCQYIWPRASRVMFAEFKPERKWQWCLWRNKEGRTDVRLPQPTQLWEQLLKESRDISGAALLPSLQQRPFLVALHTILMPHRATASVIRYLAGRLDPSSW